MEESAGDRKTRRVTLERADHAPNYEPGMYDRTWCGSISPMATVEWHRDIGKCLRRNAVVTVHS